MPNPIAPTFYDIEKSVVRELIKALGDLSLAKLPVPLSGTSQALNTSSIIDTKLAAGTVDTNGYDGRAIKVTLFDSDGPATGSVAHVTTGGYASNVITISPAVSATLEENQEYIMYPLGVHPDMVEDAIQKALRMVEMEHWTIPSLVLNAEFRRGTATSLANWTDVGTVTLLNTTQGSNEPNALFGNELKVTTTNTATEGVVSDGVNCEKDEKFLVSVFAVAGVAPLTISLYDETANTDITTAVFPSTPSSDQGGVMEARLTGTAPLNCKHVSLRFTAPTASTFKILGPAVLQSITGRLMSARSGLYRKGQIKRWFRLPLGAPSPVGTARVFHPYSLGVMDYAGPQTIIRHDSARYSTATEVIEGQRTGTPSNVKVQDSGLRFPIAPQDEMPIGVVYMRSAGETNPDAHTGTTDAEVPVDHDWAVAEALANLGIPGWRRKAQSRASIMEYGSDPNLLITPNPAVAV